MNSTLTTTYAFGSSDGSIIVSIYTETFTDDDGNPYVDEYGNEDPIYVTYAPFYADDEVRSGDYQIHLDNGGTTDAYDATTDAALEAAKFHIIRQVEQTCTNFVTNYMDQYSFEFTMAKYHKDYDIPVVNRVDLNQIYEVFTLYRSAVLMSQSTTDVLNSTVDFDQLSYNVNT